MCQFSTHGPTWWFGRNSPELYDCGACKRGDVRNRLSWTGAWRGVVDNRASVWRKTLSIQQKGQRVLAVVWPEQCACTCAAPHRQDGRTMASQHTQWQHCHMEERPKTRCKVDWWTGNNRCALADLHWAQCNLAVCSTPLLYCTEHTLPLWSTPRTCFWSFALFSVHDVKPLWQSFGKSAIEIKFA